jgi:hypothetical protein
MKRMLIFTLITLGSCNAHKSIISEKEVIKRDTIHITNNVEIYRAVHDTLTIDNPCDSLRLKYFYYKANLPQGKVIIRTIQGKIQATIDIDSMKQVYSSMYKGSNQTKIEYVNKEVVRNVVPSWAIITIIIESLIIGLYIYFKIVIPK